MIVAVRRESVQLDVTGNFGSEMVRNAAAVALLRRELDQVNGHPFFQANNRGQLTNVNVQATQATQGVNRFQRQADAAGGSINQLTGRLGLFADAALILGPGLVPIAAVGVQALGGLTAAATAAAVAGGSAIVAFQGVGDAVKALQAYQDESTIANLEKARESLRGLAPEARQFVVEFQKFKPVLGDIQKAAAAGWFPGLTASLSEFARLGPRIEHIFEAAGSAGGFLVEQSAESLSSKRWAPFLLFLQDEVPGAMASLAHIMGDLAHGAAEMFMAFDPGNDAFLGWLGDVADGFDRWASSAEAQESIQGLLEYAKQNGPEVADLFESLVGALAAIVKAAAPLGGPVLQGLTAVADMVKVIADSDLATPLLLAVGAMRLMQRVQGLVISGQGRLNSAIARTPTAAVSAQQAAALNGTGLSGTALGAALAAPRPQDARAQRNAQRMQYARAGGTALGIGLLASGAASDLNLTNTAMLTLAGSMAGPVGAALGLVAGLSLDAAKANNDLVESLDAAGTAINSGQFAAGSNALALARQQQADFEGTIEAGLGFKAFKNPGALLANTKNGLEGIFGKSDVEEGAEALKDLERQMFLNQHAAAGLGKAMGEVVGPVDGSVRSVKELQAALEAAEPAMEILGVSQQDLFKAKQRDDKGSLNVVRRGLAEQNGELGYAALTQQIADQADYMDSATYAAENYQTALKGIAEAAGTAAERADVFREAFDAIVSPKNDAEAALSAQVEGLREIRKLESGGGFNVRTETGRANLTATRDYTEAVRERIATMINAKRSEKDIAGALQQSRRQFIEAGEAAGFSTEEMKKRADQIGLTPRLVTTTFKALGITAFDKAVDTLRGKLKGVPSRVRTDMQANGVPATIAEVDALVDKYDLTDGQRTTLISLMGAAATREGAAALSAALDAAARDRQATITINTIERLTRIGAAGAGPLRYDNAAGSADGSTVPKTGRPYADRHHYMLADGEEVISNRYGQADRNRPLLKAINMGYLADGGTTGDPFTYLSNAAIKGMSTSALQREYRENAKALKEFKASLKASTTALDRERQKRDSFKDYRSEVSGSLAGDLVGNGLAGLKSGLTANRNDARSALFALRKAKKNGLDGPLFDLIASSGDINLIQQAANLSRRETAQLERQYGATVSAQNALGNFAAQEKYDTTLKGLNKTIRTLDRTTRRLGKSVERGAERGTRLGNAYKSRKTSTGTRAGR